MSGSLSIMLATDCKNKYTCMEAGLLVVGFPLLVADLLEVVEL